MKMLSAPNLEGIPTMDKLWSKTEITHLKRYAGKQSLEELAQRFHTDSESVRRKIEELGLVGAAEAAEHADQAIKLFEEGLGLFHKHDWRAAEAMFARVIDEADFNQLTDRARQYRAICLSKLAQEEPAETPYLEAIALKNHQRVDAALAVVKKNGDTAGDERWAYLAASLNALAGRDEEALALLAKAIELEPRNRVHAYHDPDFQSLRHRDGFSSLLRARA